MSATTRAVADMTARDRRMILETLANRTRDVYDPNPWTSLLRAVAVDIATAINAEDELLAELERDLGL